MVFRAKGSSSGSEADRDGAEASARGAGYAEVAKLKPAMSSAGELSLADQPLQGLGAGGEQRQIALRKRLQVLVQDFWQPLGSDPRRALDVRTIEHQRRLNDLDELLVECRTGEVGQQQHRFFGLSGYIGGKHTRDGLKLLRRAVGAIDKQDCLVFVSDETYVLIHTTPPGTARARLLSPIRLSF